MMLQEKSLPAQLDAGHGPAFSMRHKPKPLRSPHHRPALPTGKPKNVLLGQVGGTDLVHHPQL